MRFVWSASSLFPKWQTKKSANHPNSFYNIIIMKKIKSFVLLFATVIVSISFSSCATIVSGGDPSITINGHVNEPVDITTEKQTYPRVTLPAVVQVQRHKLDGQRIRITSENYNFDDIVLGKQVNGWAFGNILLGGLIGWGVDLATNCVVKPEQTQFTIQAIPKQEDKVTKKE